MLLKERFGPPNDITGWSLLSKVWVFTAERTGKFYVVEHCIQGKCRDLPSFKRTPHDGNFHK
jgi:hypothetical protein